MKHTKFLKTLGIVWCLILTSCATSPVGRRQLKLMPESQMSTMGAQAFSQLKSQTPISSDQALNKYVKCVVAPLTKEITGPTQVKEWEVVVFDEPKTINAFALPGGKIGVYTGILKVATTPDQLAAILGHEIGHIIAHHGNERVSEGLVAQGGLAAAGILTQDNPKRNWIMALLGLGTQFGILMPHGRTQESEADIIGVDLMARAGFDPKESVELWKNMAKASGDGPPEFLSTHPSHGTRIENLTKRLSTASGIFQEARAQGKNPKCPRP